ncbi:MAG TPA: hypothetical protein PLP19_11385 [bacterium]|mgnify:CR=1 FL=1|nr:hypothetical protein [bacterium]HPN44084.1 hypothetical protein [bacterium]
MAVKDKVVLVLGAGASYNYGFPTAKELREEINRFDFDKLLKDQNYYPQSIKLISEGLNLIRNNFYESNIFSIDAWLAIEENIIAREAGKYVITALLTKCEERSIVEYVNPFNRDRIPIFKDRDSYTVNDWYSILFNNIVKTAKKLEDFAEDAKNLSIITFNYDQSLEAYFQKSIKKAYYGKNDKDYVKQLNNIRILHVYGKIRPYQSDISFWGYNSDPNNIYERSKDIKIIPEVREESEELKEIKSIIKEADKIFFIGFSYDEENLKKLGIPDTFQIKEKKVYGTSIGLYEGEVKKIKTLIRGTRIPSKYSLNLQAESQEAFNFFREKVIEIFT